MQGTDVNNIVFWSENCHCHRVNAEKEDSVMKSGKIWKRRKLGVAEEEKGSYRHLVERLINCETLKNE